MREKLIWDYISEVPVCLFSFFLFLPHKNLVCSEPFIAMENRTPAPPRGFGENSFDAGMCLIFALGCMLSWMQWIQSMLRSSFVGRIMTRSRRS